MTGGLKVRRERRGRTGTCGCHGTPHHLFATGYWAMSTPFCQCFASVVKAHMQECSFPSTFRPPSLTGYA